MRLRDPGQPLPFFKLGFLACEMGTLEAPAHHPCIRGSTDRPAVLGRPWLVTSMWGSRGKGSGATRLWGHRGRKEEAGLSKGSEFLVL